MPPGKLEPERAASYFYRRGMPEPNKRAVPSPGVYLAIVRYQRGLAVSPLIIVPVFVIRKLRFEPRDKSRICRVQPTINQPGCWTIGAETRGRIPGRPPA